MMVARPPPGLERRDVGGRRGRVVEIVRNHPPQMVVEECEEGL